MKLELCEYANSYIKRNDGKTLIPTNSTGLIAIINTIFIIPVLFVRVYLGIMLACLFVCLLIKSIQEKDKYARELLQIFIFVFFCFFSALIGLNCIYSVLWFSVIALVFGVVLYEIIFLIKIKKKKYSSSKFNSKKRCKPSIVCIFLSISVGRVIGIFFKKTPWLVFPVIIFFIILIVFAITYIQRYVFYKKYQKEISSINFNKK